jgi:hypothetical protein
LNGDHSLGLKFFALFEATEVVLDEEGGVEFTNSYIVVTWNSGRVSIKAGVGENRRLFLLIKWLVFEN